MNIEIKKAKQRAEKNEEGRERQCNGRMKRTKESRTEAL
jgi:hypothetical protein